MLKSRQLALAITMGTFCTTAMIGMASAQTVPAITARAGEILHIPYTVNATAASQVGYHWGNKDGAMVGFLTTSKGWINAIHGEPSYQSASVPVYGFGPAFANSTKQPGENVHGDKGTFVFKLPSDMKTGSYTLALYYVDGIDRHVEMERMITVGDVHTSTTSLSLTANPIMPTVGSATTLTVTIPPDLNSGTGKAGEFVELYDKTTGAIVFAHAVNSASGKATDTTTHTSKTAGTQTFVARLWNAGVTSRNHPPSLTSNSTTVTWVKPSITLSSSPSNNFTGQTTIITYSYTMPSGDYVAISGNGGTDMWSTTLKSDSSWLYTPSNEKVGNNATIPANVWTMQQKNQQGYYSLSDIFSMSGLTQTTNGTFDSITPLTVTNVPLH